MTARGYARVEELERAGMSHTAAVHQATLEGQSQYPYFTGSILDRMSPASRVALEQQLHPERAAGRRSQVSSGAHIIAFPGGK